MIKIRYSVFKVHRLIKALQSKASGRFKEPNGDGEIRTHDPLLARQVLSQLSYTPIWLFLVKKEMGLRRLELPTSRLSGVRSNLLSYKPLHQR